MRVAMRWMIGSAVSVLYVCLTPTIHSQKAATAAPPLAATDPRLRSTADEYLELLHRVQQGDMSVDFRAFRIAGALVAGPHVSATEVADRNAFKRFMAASNPQGALESSDRTLDIDYASTVAHFNAMMACRALKKEDEAAKHEKLLNALLDSIAKDGDGKAPETSYPAVTTQEEYIFMALRLNVKASEQSLVTQNGHSYDRLKVFDSKTNTTQYLWFNADIQVNPEGLPAPSSTGSPKDSAAPVVIATAKRTAPANARADDLINAASNGDLPRVKVLLDKGGDVNAKSGNGATALIGASGHGHLAVVQALLDKGAEVNARMSDGMTGLYLSSFMGHLDVVQTLLSKGAEVNVKTSTGASALTMASYKGFADVVQALLAKGADVNAKASDGGTALMAASQGGHIEVVQALLAQGAGVNAKTNDGATALIMASRAGHLHVVRVLLAKGAEIDGKTSMGATPLMTAAVNGHLEIVQEPT